MILGLMSPASIRLVERNQDAEEEPAVRQLCWCSKRWESQVIMPMDIRKVKDRLRCVADAEGRVRGKREMTPEVLA